MNAPLVVDGDLELAMNATLGAVARNQAWRRYEGRRWAMVLATHAEIAENTLTDDERWNIRIFRR